MARKETATEAFNKGLACSQAVAIAFAQDYGIETDAVLKLSPWLWWWHGWYGWSLRRSDWCVHGYWNAL